MAGDPYFNNVESLWRFHDTGLTDLGSAGNTITLNGDCAVSGTTGLVIPGDGSTANYATMPALSADEYKIDGEDVTIELLGLVPGSFNYAGFILSRRLGSAPDGGIQLFMDSDGAFRVNIIADNSNTNIITTAGALSIGVAADATVTIGSSKDVTIFIDGEIAGTGSYSGTENPTNSDFYWGRQANGPSPSTRRGDYTLRECRWSKGVIRYTGSYTPPSTFPTSLPPSGPSLTAPTGTETGTTTATGTVDTDTDTGTAFSVVSESDTKPEIAEIQAGEDSTGSAAPWGGSQSVSATGTLTFNATGLVQNTTYYFHYQQKDGDDNDSSVATSPPFTTESDTILDPIISEQPQDTLVFESTVAQFIVNAYDPQGGPLTYQWYYAIDDSLIAGATSAVLSITTTLNDAGNQYYCIVSKAGGNDVQSSTATLSVISQGSQQLSGKLYSAGYPSFFPCPTWEYGQEIGPSTARTQFSSGWVRQRKQWREEVSSATLTFSMPTTMFDNWSRWMINNGYHDWFTIYLDRFYGIQALYEVRLISRIDWQYRTHDVVAATVMAEMGGVVNTGEYDEIPPPPFGPEDKLPGVDSRPECLPYSCSAYEDYNEALTEEAFNYLYKQDHDTWDFPFATDDTSTSKLRAWSGPSGSTPDYDWSSSVPGSGANGSSIGLPQAWDRVNEPDFCGGKVQQVVNIRPLSFGNIVVTPPDPVWGRYTANAVVTGFNGGELIQGRLIEGGNQRLIIEGSAGIVNPQFNMGITTDSSGPHPVQTMFLSVHDNNNTSPATAPLGRIGNKWNLISAYVSTGIGAIVQVSTFRWDVDITTTARVSCAGVVLDITKITTYTTDIGTGQPPTISPAAADLASGPRFFRQALVSFLSVNQKVLTEDYDYEALKIAFDRNFTDYEPPGYCNI